MLLTVVSALLAIPFAHAGLIHTEHTHEVLDNIHNTPHCAYTCIFDENYQLRWANQCAGLQEGEQAGSCFCRANAYQYIVDQCWERKCKPEDRKKAREMNYKSCKHYGVDEKDMYTLEEIKS